MASVVFDGEISYESVGNLVALLDDVKRSISEDEMVTLYFSSNGGEASASMVFIDYLESLSNEVNLEIVGNGILMSAGFDIFYMTKCQNKRILKGTIGMIHESTTGVSSRAIKQNGSMDRFRIDEEKKANREINNWYKKLGITEDELKIIKNGDDLFLGNARLKQLLKNTTKGNRHVESEEE